MARLKPSQIQKIPEDANIKLRDVSIKRITLSKIGLWFYSNPRFLNPAINSASVLGARAAPVFMAAWATARAT